MKKQVFFYIDDVIWCLRDIAKERPASIFDHPFFKMLKKAHDEYGTTVQLNLFYRTDFSYGDVEFNLTQMPDCYKDEFKSNKDWMLLAFHGKQEFPNYPYVNSSYEFLKNDCDEVQAEIRRFAGEECISPVVVPHCLPISRDGCRALYDCGIKFITSTYGEKYEFTADDGTIQKDFIQRILYRRKPETMLYKKLTGDGTYATAVCAYNHITTEQSKQIWGYNKSVLNDEFPIRYKHTCSGPILNCLTMDTLPAALEKIIGAEFIGIGNHEQYFYPEYTAYQPEYADKLYLMAKTLRDAGYRFITADEME